MAHFRGTIEGQRGEASRLGSKNSGLRVTANGWNAGVTVIARHEDGRDMFDVLATGGSGYTAGQGLIAVVTDDAGKMRDMLALYLIREAMSASDWSADTLDRIAGIVELTGRKIEDSAEVDA